MIFFCLLHENHTLNSVVLQGNKNERDFARLNSAFKGGYTSERKSAAPFVNSDKVLRKVASPVLHSTIDEGIFLSPDVTRRLQKKGLNHIEPRKFASSKANVLWC